MICNSLYNFFTRKENVSETANRVATVVSLVKHSSDGFIYLVTILHRLLPQFGGPSLNLITEIQSLFVNNGEDLEDFHMRAQALQSHIELSRMIVPPTLLFEHYLSQLNQTQHLVPLLSPYNHDFARHKRDVGDHIPFSESLDSVYDFLLESKCSTTLSVPNCSYSLHCPDCKFEITKMCSL